MHFTFYMQSDKIFESGTIMKKLKVSTSVSVLVIFFWAIGAIRLMAQTSPADEAKPKLPSLLFPQGYFDAVRLKNNLPVRWNLWDDALASKVSLIEDGRNRYLRLTCDNVATPVGIQTRVKINPTWKRLLVTSNMAIRRLNPGKEAWQTARVTFQFEDEKQKVVGGFQPALSLAGVSDWKPVEARLTVPEGASYLKVEPCFMGSSGIMEVDDITIVLDTAGGDFPQGAFDVARLQGNLPRGWNLWATSQAPFIKLAGDKSNRWLTISNNNAAQSVGLVTRLKIEPSWSNLSVKSRMATQDLHPGQKPWQIARVMFQFEDKSLQKVGGYQPSLDIKQPGDSAWRDMSIELEIPRNAAFLKIEPGLYNATGSVAIDDITISAAKENEGVLDESIVSDIILDESKVFQKSGK
jgi:hypothetical protein